MGWLRSEKPPERWSQAYFKAFVERLRTAVNFLDSENFPEGIHGTLINNRSIGLTQKTTGYGGLVIQSDFFTLMTSSSIAQTVITTFGSSILWSPTWRAFATLHLEVTGAASNASHPCTVEVHGIEGAIISQQISDTTFQRREWQIATPPTTGMTLIFRARTSNASFPLTILSARLILKLTEITQ